ncbi:MAG: orotidine-5'-phosphate decarboxylase [Acidobacteria bacterium]|nr:MAG: orotidine-5'-phosphate decarboxylase [Acidobacteriota bacterium]PYV37343.1 MAG: orotidine-5'-phosphate decarboxylase [Acidobacteriota bacterium]
MSPKPKTADRLIVALDVDTTKKALDIIEDLNGLVSFFKVGYQLFIAEGLTFVRRLIEGNNRVFLDLKMDDVEETIRRAVANIAASEVEFLTIHGSGATVRAARDGRGAREKPKLLSVTLLSSLDANDLKDLFADSKLTVESYVKWRAKQAIDNGCEGLIASGETIGMLRKLYPSAIIVAPGIRPADSSRDDHKRALSPDDAIRAGADYLVVGRPIRNSSNPRNAAEKIIEEMEQAFQDLRFRQ